MARATTASTLTPRAGVSSRQPRDASAAHARLLHGGCDWVTTEMALFEWMERAGTDTFRALSSLIK